MSVYVIAEAGINHQGLMPLAEKMAMEAKLAGANAVKFQTYATDDICRADNPEYAWLKKCELTYGDFRQLKLLCDTIGIDFISTPDTVKDAEFLDTLGMRYMKIGSANATHAFLRSIEHLRTPLIVSHGLRSEVSDRHIHDNMKVAMHCVSAYPCPIEDANIAVISEHFCGFSDHTIGDMCAIMAVARGAQFIEKHFTLDHTQEGPDHHMSVEPDELARYIRSIRMAEKALGDGVRRVMPCEQKTIEQLKGRK